MTVNSIGIKMVDGKDFVYEGYDAHVIYHGIESASARGASCTAPLELSDGAYIVFVLANISAFYFTKEESE